MKSQDSRRHPIARLPTSLTTFVLLVLAFFPLGLFAILETLDRADRAQEDRNAEVNIVAEIGANHLARTIMENEQNLRSAVTRIANGSATPETCRSIVSETFGAEPLVASLTIFDDSDQTVCSVGDAPPMPRSTTSVAGDTAIMIEADRPAIVIAYTAVTGAQTGIMVLDRESAALLPQPGILARNYEIALRHDGEKAVIRPWSEAVSGDRILRAEHAVGATDFVLLVSYEAIPPGPREIFRITLPILMWLLAAVASWIAITFLLIRPLRKLRQTVIDHAEGTAPFKLPVFPASATEIQQLAKAFEAAFDKLQSHEEQLAAGLEEQTRLTREVHHRVKNNLQVIASLLSLHARAAKSDDSAAAYASIQRRVDALAIVQRNLFAELDKDTGLAFRPVVAELASGLQQSAPADARIAITLDIDPIRVSQDIAAPAAFLITELVELAMLCGDRAEIAITVTALPDRCARLSIRSPALAEASARDEFPRYRRVLTGMARQLQACLDEDDSGMMFTIVMQTLDTL